jgi:flagellar L-ring protein precursor FlgH
VVSTAIADAKISISGKGVIADKQNPGYGHRAFDWVWPF